MQSKVAGTFNPNILVAVVIVVLVGAVTFWVNRDDPEPEIEPVPVQTPVVQRIEIEPLPETPPDLATEYELQGELPAISESDAAVRAHLQLLGGLTALEWVEGDQTIRRIVVQVANIADGDLIYQQTPLQRQDTMAVLDQQGDDVYRIDPAGYQRYDAYADFLAGIQPDLLVAFYRYYEPLLDQAYAELGNPIGAFRGELITAIEMILTTPVIEGDIELIQSGEGYEFRDEALEALPSIHKQLIRMGPENTRKIQTVLRAFRDRIS